MRLISNIGDFNVKSTGQLYLTTIRLIFVADTPSSDFKSLDVPLLLIRNEKFNMPIFGCSNLSFMVIPQTSWGCGTQFNCKLEFRKGGAQTFLRIFWKVMSGVNEVRECHDRNSISSSVRDIASGSFVSQVFVDPTDPSYVYTTQPCQPTVALPVNYPVPVYYTIPQAVPMEPTYAQPPAAAAAAQPTYAQPAAAAQPIYAQPTYAQPSPAVQTAYTQPSPAAQPTYTQPSPAGQAVYVQPVYPQPVYAQPAPMQAMYNPNPDPNRQAYTPPTYATQPTYSQPMYTPPGQKSTQ